MALTPVPTKEQIGMTLRAYLSVIGMCPELAEAFMSGKTPDATVTDRISVAIHELLESVPEQQDPSDGTPPEGLGDRGRTALNDVPRDVGVPSIGHDCLAPTGYEGVQHGN